MPTSVSCPQGRSVWTRRGATFAAVAALVVVVPVALARDVSPAVKQACASDYFAHCSMHQVGSQALRKCMRAVGRRLSPRCVNALVAAGEVSKAEVKRRARAANLN